MGTPARYYSSTAVRTTLAASVSSTDTEVNVASSTNFPTQYPFTLIFEKDSANEEIVTVTSMVGTALVVTRGFDGTSARAHAAGTSVEHGVSAKEFTDFRTHEAASNGVHDIGSGSAVVGTATTQVISNKTLGGNLAAGGFKVTGLGDPSSAQDAVTKNWAETGMTSQLALATTQATNSATSAAASATSATASATSATASQASRVASETAKTASETARTQAQTSQSAAATSATSAATSATAAAGSATTATTQASTATTQAGNAASSATAAAASATGAASSAVSASNSAAAAAASLDSFDDRYLGSKTVAPTVDNDGNALVQGALYYLSVGASTVKGMYVYDGASWIKATSSSVATISTFEYTATASQTVFSGLDSNSVSMSFGAGLIQVFLNGVLLNPGDDYTTTLNTVTLIGGVVAGDSLTVVAFSPFSIADVYTIAQTDAAIAAATSSAGVADGSITSAKIADGTIVNADINASAAIAPTKISGTAVVDSDARLTNSRTPTAHKSSHATGGSDALVPSDIGAAPASGIAPSAITGTAVITTDARLSDTRIPTDNSVTSAKIVDGAIVNADINAAAAIDQSKVANLTTDLAAKAPLVSPSFTGVPAAPTAAVDTNTTQVATTAYVVGQGYLKSATATSTYAPLASPILTGNPTAPTATVGDNDTTIATTAFVNAEIAADAVLDSTFTTKGDIVVASGANTPVRLGVGSINQVLTVDSTTTTGVKWADVASTQPFDICVACSDETTPLTVGTGKATFRLPRAMSITQVRASVTTAPTGSTIIVDINKNGVSILTTKLSIDATEKRSTTAAVQPVISATVLSDDEEITIDIDQVGSTVAGAGLKVWLIGNHV